MLQVAEPEGYMDKRKRKGKEEAPKYATADGQALPVKRPRSTPSQGAPPSLCFAHAILSHLSHLPRGDRDCWCPF